MTEVQPQTQIDPQQQAKTDRVQVNVTDPSKPVRVIEVPVQQTPSWIQVADEIKSGIWAVALTGAVLWLGTAKLRDTLLENIKAYYKRQIEVLDVVKRTSEENNELLRRLLKMRPKNDLEE